MNPTIVTVFFYNRLFDPLIMGNFWVFIKDIQTRLPGHYKFHFITFEDDAHPLTEVQSQRLREMEGLDVSWTALRWHRGASIRSKIADIFAGFRAVTNQRFLGCKHIISYNSVAGSFCYLYARLLAMRLYMYSYEPHSEYALDNGMLSESSLQYQVLHILERRAANFASVISSGTRFMQQRLEEEWKITGRFFKIPSVTDERKFSFDNNMRALRRAELGLGFERKVLFYPGKFGDLYYGAEIAQMFRWLLNEDPTLFFLILTQQPAEMVTVLFQDAGVPQDSYAIRRADYDQVQTWFWAADFGIVAVPSGPSKRFISNIKVGEYLCAGLPFLITEGVSEDYLFAQENSVGVVVKDFDEASIREAWPHMRKLLVQDPEARRAHCTQAGRSYRGFETLKWRFEEALETLVERP